LKEEQSRSILFYASASPRIDSVVKDYDRPAFREGPTANCSERSGNETMRQLRQSGVLILALMTGLCPRQIGKRLKSENGLKKYNEGFGDRSE